MEFGGYYCHKIPLEHIKFLLRKKHGDAHIECIQVKFTKIIVTQKDDRKIIYFLSEHSQYCQIVRSRIRSLKDYPVFLFFYSVIFCSFIKDGHYRFVP